MLNVIINRDSSFCEIAPLFVGYEKCAPSHSFGPHCRDYYIVHFCISGKGILNDKYGTHHIKEGELFIIRKGEITAYSADLADPWEYVWIAFDGTHAEIFDGAQSVYIAPFDLMQKLLKYTLQKIQTPHIYLSVIYELTHGLFYEKNEKGDVAASIKRYIEYNYMERITIADIAVLYSFDRTYIYKLFKKRYGVGVKEFITNEKIKNAKRFLSQGISVAKCAFMVGYCDEFNFSRVFKKCVGCPPSEYRKYHKSNFM